MCVCSVTQVCRYWPLFPELQKCHTVEQYLKCGRAKALYSFNIVEVFTSLGNLIITLSWLLTILQIRETCLSKFNWLSIVTPRRSSDFSVLKENWWFGDPRTTVWYLSGLTIILCTAYHVFSIWTSRCMHKSRATGLTAVTVVQLLVVCVCMKFHMFDVLEKVVQEDVEEHRSENGSLWDIFPNSLPARIRIANFYPLHPPRK